MKDTKIEWCDHSWSPWRGCTKVSAGCANCYAETLSKRNPKVLGEWGRGKPRVLAKNWNDPVKWNRRVDASLELAEPMGMKLKPVTVFPSLCDWLDEEVPIEWLARFLQLIHDTPNLTWLLLTKRPENWRSRINEVWKILDLPADRQRFAEMWIKGTPPANVWIGTSVEDQPNADRRIPELLKIPAVGRFLSLEPLLGPVVLKHCNGRHDCPLGDAVGHSDLPFGGIDWLIIGGESGHGARPCNVEWVRSLVKQGREASVAPFVKQLGAVACDDSRNDVEFALSQRGRGFLNQIPLTHPKGGDPSEWAEDMRVREFPEGLR